VSAKSDLRADSLARMGTACPPGCLCELVKLSGSGSDLSVSEAVFAMGRYEPWVRDGLIPADGPMALALADPCWGLGGVAARARPPLW